LHYPNEVPTSGGELIPSQSWKHYSLATDLTHENAQGAMWSDFSVSLFNTLFEFVFLMNNSIIVILEFDIA
jgi:hypothetical protein